MPLLCATPPPEPSSSATSSFTELPRETRDEIYSYIVPSYTQLNIFPTATVDSLRIIARHLPTNLLLSHQVLEEAALLWLKRSRIIVELGAFKTLKGVLDGFSEEAGWKSVRELEFIDWQQCYASRSMADNESTTTSGYIYDIVLRCPGLRKLSMILCHSFSFSLTISTRTQIFYASWRAESSRASKSLWKSRHQSFTDRKRTGRGSTKNARPDWNEEREKREWSLRCRRE